MPEIGDTRQGDGTAVHKPRECYGPNGRRKSTFATKTDAKRALKQIVGVRQATGEPAQRGMKAYRCGTCGRYHLGHKA